MNKLQKISILILFGWIVVSASPAEAQIKFDFGSLAGSIQELVGRIQGKISDVQRYVQSQVTMLTRVAGEAKGLVADAKSRIESAKATVSGAVGKATDAVNSAKSAVDQAKEAAANTAGAALAKAQELKQLQMDISVAQESYKQALMDIEDSIFAETEKYEENNEKLQKMMDQTNDSAQKASYQTITMQKLRK